eukprot:8374528-Lingulodinium_polyedra.AAC.1
MRASTNNCNWSPLSSGTPFETQGLGHSAAICYAVRSAFRTGVLDESGEHARILLFGISAGLAAMLLWH